MSVGEPQTECAGCEFTSVSRREVLEQIVRTHEAILDATTAVAA